jgi:hypothetical protein
MINGMTSILKSKFFQICAARNSANLGLLIDKPSSIYMYVKLKALAS